MSDLHSPYSNPLDDAQYRRHAARKLFWLLLAAALALSFRLFYLQVVQGEYHKSLSEQNSIRLQVIKAPRGLIYDRNGTIIASNRPSYQIAIMPTELRKDEPVLENLLRFRDMTGAPVFDSARVARALERARWRRFQPLVIYEDAPFEVVSLVEEHQTLLPGVVTLVESRRTYPFGSVAAHVLGYLDEVKEDELGLPRGMLSPDSLASPYERGDRIGRKGMERQYEKYFRGRDGMRYVKINAFGRQINVVDAMPNREPQPGKNVYTTLDMGLQAYAESLLSDTARGAVVALDPRNGEILAMVAAPGMDGNMFSLSRERRAREWARLALDPSRPLHNRAVNGGYEPASTFKAITSLAGLEAGIDPEAHMPRACTGGFRFGNRVWRCWKPEGHGFLDAIEAFAQSCDVYYYQLGLAVGMERINAMARRFGFGSRTGVDLEGDREGLLMDSVTYGSLYSRRGWQWTRGMILNLSMGQGQIATPLQLANYTAGMVNGDVIYRPRLLREVRDARGRLLHRSGTEVLHEIGLDGEERELLIASLSAAVNGTKGTGRGALVPGVWVGGKTGSAQNPHGEEPHALFVGAAPLDNPRIVVAVVLENAGGGGAVAAPIAGALMKRFFENVP